MKYFEALSSLCRKDCLECIICTMYIVHVTRYVLFQKGQRPCYNIIIYNKTPWPIWRKAVSASYSLAQPLKVNNDLGTCFNRSQALHKQVNLTTWTQGTTKAYSEVPMLLCICTWSIGNNIQVVFAYWAECRGKQDLENLSFLVFWC